MAYQLVQVIRRRLKEVGETASWMTLRQRLTGQQRVTAVFRQQDGRNLHGRNATRAELGQQAIYDALGVTHSPGGINKLTAAATGNSQHRRNVVPDAHLAPRGNSWKRAVTKTGSTQQSGLQNHETDTYRV